ncbi:MAG: hypothetical protein ACRC8B_22915 [Aeromonas sobria]|uniref:hypothetical protein n=1 Tax=Aeromonas sobria TaxID=646 RepID=UPI003F2E8E42
MSFRYIATFLTSGAATLFLITSLGQAYADDKIDIFASGHAKKEEAKKQEWKETTGIESTQDYLDWADGVIQRAEKAERQAERVKRLFER